MLKFETEEYKPKRNYLIKIGMKISYIFKQYSNDGEVCFQTVGSFYHIDPNPKNWPKRRRQELAIKIKYFRNRLKYRIDVYNETGIKS